MYSAKVLVSKLKDQFLNMEVREQEFEELPVFAETYNNRPKLFIGYYAITNENENVAHGIRLIDNAEINSTQTFQINLYVSIEKLAETRIALSRFLTGLSILPINTPDNSIIGLCHRTSIIIYTGSNCCWLRELWDISFPSFGFYN